jgi:epsin
MDLNNLKNTVSNLTLYDLKAGVRQIQNGMSSGLESRVSSLESFGQRGMEG